MSDGIKGIKVDRHGTITEIVMETKSKFFDRGTTMREALQHIAAGHDVVCLQCGWAGYKKEAQNYFFLVCPECKCQAIRIGADEIAAYALRQIEGGGE